MQLSLVLRLVQLAVAELAHFAPIRFKDDGSGSEKSHCAGSLVQQAGYVCPSGQWSFFRVVMRTPERKKRPRAVDETRWGSSDAIGVVLLPLVRLDQDARAFVVSVNASGGRASSHLLHCGRHFSKVLEFLEGIGVRLRTRRRVSGPKAPHCEHETGLHCFDGHRRLQRRWVLESAKARRQCRGAKACMICETSGLQTLSASAIFLIGLSPRTAPS